MTSDLNRSLSLEYALGINLPERIMHNEGQIHNQYTLSGQKLSKKVFDSRSNLQSTERYMANLVLENNTPARILHEDGVINLSGGSPTFHYHIKDHLGNVRLVITPDASNNPIVLQANDYYPFGMSYSTAPGVNKYLYNSKEEQEMPGKFLDYGWRMYDAQLGRFHSVDPLAADFPFQAPYLYASNNPIRFIDFMGLNAEDPEDEKEEERKKTEEEARLQAQQAAIQDGIDALNKAVFQYKLSGGQSTESKGTIEGLVAQSEGGDQSSDKNHAVLSWAGAIALTRTSSAGLTRIPHPVAQVAGWSLLTIGLVYEMVYNEDGRLDNSKLVYTHKLPSQDPIHQEWNSNNPINVPDIVWWSIGLSSGARLMHEHYKNTRPSIPYHPPPADNTRYIKPYVPNLQ